MNQNQIKVAIGSLLAIIAVLLLFSFQVRQTEVALVTTFGKPSRNITEPGWKWKLPWPIQSVQKFDKRIQTFEDKSQEVLTADARNLLVMVYVGWNISDPTRFRLALNSMTEAEKNLESLLRSEKSAVVGKHPFAHFISTDEKELQFAQIEKDILDRVRPQAKDKYGIDIQFLGIKKLALPEAITERVFERMKAERQKYVQDLKAQGEARAIDIRSEAELERGKIIAAADAKVIELRGEAEAEARKHYEILEQNPPLAIFLKKLTTLEQSLKERSTLILDEHTPPFDLLRGTSVEMPARTTGKQ